MKNTTHSRRNFLRIAGLGTAASLMSLQDGDSGTVLRGAERTANERKHSFQLALASYTLRKFDLDQTLAMTKQVGLKAICLKSFHLPLDATPEQIAAAAAKVKEAGIVLYGGGVIAMSKEEQVHQAFDYAKAAGMSKIVGVPHPDQLPLVNEKVQKYDIEVCIHNHGPGDKVYPTPDIAYEKIKDLDKRIGLCHDIGHTVRYGKDPVAVTEQCADRILDVHIKDVSATGKAGKTVACGQGIIDLPAILRTLVKIRYSGYVAFEYEANPDDPMPGLTESVQYIRGLLDTI